MELSDFRKCAEECIYQCENIAKLWQELNERYNSLRNNAEALKRHGIDSEEIDKLVDQVERDIRQVYNRMFGH